MLQAEFRDKCRMQNADPSTAEAVPLPFQGRQAKCKITDETVNDTVGTRLAVSVAGLNKNKTKEKQQ